MHVRQWLCVALTTLTVPAQPAITGTVVGPDGPLPHALVRVLDVPDGSWEGPDGPAVITTVPSETTPEKEAFDPPLTVIRTDQDLVVKLTGTGHCIHFKSRLNGEWSQTVAGGGELRRERPFEKPEVGSCWLTCDGHPAMRARVAVLDHPYFAVTAADGTFRIPPGLPEGTYRLRAWHPAHPTRPSVAMVVPGQTATVDFVMEKRRRKKDLRPRPILAGRVDWVGPRPPRREVRVDDNGCLAENGRFVPLHDDLRITRFGRLRDVVVALETPPPGSRAPAAGHVGVVIRAFAVRRRLIPVQIGQRLRVRNHDPVVHSLSIPDHGSLTLSPGPWIEHPWRPRRPGRHQLRCDINPYLRAGILVFDHPWFTEVDDRGAFHFEGLPPGTYGLIAYAPNGMTRTATGTITATAGSSVTFRFSK